MVGVLLRDSPILSSGTLCQYLTLKFCTTSPKQRSTCKSVEVIKLFSGSSHSGYTNMFCALVLYLSWSRTKLSHFGLRLSNDWGQPMNSRCCLLWGPTLHGSEDSIEFKHRIVLVVSGRAVLRSSIKKPLHFFGWLIWSCQGSALPDSNS